MKPVQTVLVVEDDPIVLEISSELLKELGYHVVQAVTAAEAVAISKKTPIDLVLLDKTLPDGDGLDIVPYLLTDSPYLKVVLCSGDALASDWDAQSVGICDNLPKPFSLDNLKTILKKHLG